MAAARTAEGVWAWDAASLRAAGRGLALNIRATWDSDRYSLGETAKLTIKAENDGDAEILVRMVNVHFRQHSPSRDIKQLCSVPIRPGNTETIKTWDVRLGPWATRTGALLRVDASYMLTGVKPSKGGRRAVGDDLPLPLRIDDASPNGMRIVISHSNKDDGALLEAAKSTVKRLGFGVYVAEEDSRLDEPLHQKILKNVAESDGILLLLTENGMKSLDVREELGYARMKKRMSGAGMKIMPLVAEGVRPTGLLAGAEYMTMDPRNLRNVADVVASAVLDEFLGKAGGVRQQR